MIMATVTGVMGCVLSFKPATARLQKSPICHLQVRQETQRQHIHGMKIRLPPGINYGSGMIMEKEYLPNGMKRLIFVRGASAQLLLNLDCGMTIMSGISNLGMIMAGFGAMGCVFLFQNNRT